MRKTILFITILLLAGLILTGISCGQAPASDSEGEKNGSGGGISEDGDKENGEGGEQETCEDVPNVYLEYCEWYLSQVETDQSGTYSWNTPCACAKKHAQGEGWRWEACLESGDPEEWCRDAQEFQRKIYRDCIGSSDPKCGVGLGN